MHSIKFVLLLFVLSTSVLGVLRDFHADENEIIDIPKLAREHPFDNPDGGAWKQGWPIQLNHQEFALPEDKLNVFVIPHSHNDPGWIKTYDDYFSQQVNSILNSALTALVEDERRSFIYAEISFFDKWWTHNPDRHNQFREILKTGRFEFVTGGWVMNDEAASYYPAIITQLTEGHEWLRRNLDYKPQSGWSIDPFGYSPTQAYLLSLSGFQHMLIQRVHYVLKKHLAKNKQLEFVWRQEFSTENSTDIFTHLMPFFSYDIPHTCGPEPAFSKTSTAWGGRIEPINAGNLKEKSGMLLDQYRKKSTLYKTKNVLAPLGDDFTYDGMNYVNQMFPNHQQIHDFLNKDSQSHVSIKFSNLTNYFESVKKSSQQNSIKFPVLKGDFFTYADREEDYWSGYFTSRAFFKGLDRLVETTTRTAEILHTILRITKPDILRPIDKEIFESIQNARRAISLFQHHDGITGTAKPHVVRDYGNRLHNARWEMNDVNLRMTELILGSPEMTPLLSQSEIKKSYSEIPERKVIEINGVQPVVFYNSLSFDRKQLVSVLVNNASLRVQNSDGAGVVVQVNPVWENDNTIATDKFEIFWEAEIPAMGYNTYFIHPYDLRIMRKRGAKTVFAEVTIKGPQGSLTFGGRPVNYISDASDIFVTNKFTSILFASDTGLMSTYTILGKTPERVQVKEDLIEYDPSGGAYLFLPKGQAQSVATKYIPRAIRMVKGEVLQEVTTLRHISTRTVRLCISDDPLSAHPQVSHHINLLDGNRELAVRYSTDIPTQSELYTDLNGLQLQKRKYRADKPIQFNYYPITATAFIQSESRRLTVQTRQAMGAASLADGTLELMLDRILSQDDNRGLGEPVRDNLPMDIETVMMMEIATQGTLGREMSEAANRVSLMLNHPLTVLYGKVENEKQWRKQYYSNYFALKSEKFPTDMHFISLRARDALQDSSEIAAQTIRLAYDPAFTNSETTTTIQPFKWFFVARLVTLYEHTLTLLYPKQQWNKGEPIPAKPRDIHSFLMTFTPIDPTDLDLNEDDDEQQNASEKALKGETEDKKDTPFMNRRVGESIETFDNMGRNDPKPTTPTKKKPKVDDANLSPEVRELEKQLEKIENEKEALREKLESEISHSKSNRLIALTFVILGLFAIIYLRKAKNIFYIFFFALCINILVPVFLFLPESGHI